MSFTETHPLLATNWGLGACVEVSEVIGRDAKVDGIGGKPGCRFNVCVDC